MRTVKLVLTKGVLPSLKKILSFALLIIPLSFFSCIEDKIDPLLVGSIHGVVVSKATGNAISDVEINTTPVTSMVFTNAQGEFIIENIPEGEYVVTTKAEGFSRESVKIKVYRNSTSEINVRLATSNILAPPPRAPYPVPGSMDQPLTITLKWSVDKNHNDSLRYTLKVYEANQTVLFHSVKNLADTVYTLEGLKYNTTYFWQIDVLSATDNVTSGEIWLFKTIPFPDNRIVFTTKRDGNYELYSSGADGKSMVRLTTGSSFELRPFWSKDRNRIAFTSNEGIDYHIYTMNKDGSGINRITTLPVAGYHNQGVGFSWSPDNGKFIYSHYDRLYRIDKDGVNLTRVATAPANRTFRGCDWSGVNNKIVVETVGSFIYDSEIYLMNNDGTDTVRLVDNLPGIIESPSFTIDGKEILFTRDISGFQSADGRQLDAHIFLIDIATQAIIDISQNKPNGTNDLHPRISPDGAKIIFVNTSNDGTGKKSIWIMNKDGSQREMIIADGEMPSWQ